MNIGRPCSRKSYAVSKIRRCGNAEYEWDKDTGFLIMDRVLSTSTEYPANYGFIPRKYAADKDPLDVLVLCSEALAPLSLVKGFPVGVICMIDDEDMDEKIIALPFAIRCTKTIPALKSSLCMSPARFRTSFPYIRFWKTSPLWLRIFMELKQPRESSPDILAPIKKQKADCRKYRANIREQPFTYKNIPSPVGP